MLVRNFAHINQVINKTLRTFSQFPRLAFIGNPSFSTREIKLFLALNFFTCDEWKMWCEEILLWHEMRGRITICYFYRTLLLFSYNILFFCCRQFLLFFDKIYLTLNLICYHIKYEWAFAGSRRVLWKRLLSFAKFSSSSYLSRYCRYPVGRLTG